MSKSTYYIRVHLFNKIIIKGLQILQEPEHKKKCLFPAGYVPHQPNKRQSKKLDTDIAEVLVAPTRNNLPYFLDSYDAYQHELKKFKEMDNENTNIFDEQIKDENKVWYKKVSKF